MTQPNQRIKRIYEAVLREAPQRRDAYLDRICGGDSEVRNKVERLLAARDQLGDFLAEPTRANGSALPPGIEEVRDAAPPPVKSNGTPPNRQGTVIGRYKLLQKIGEGGFGDVYMAVQSEPVKRKVALKIIKLGMDTSQVVARFEAERQALALMDHPNIARILDGGATQNGRPYFVMELVRGVPITEYCDTAHLDVRERLELFRKVCHAVQHAHTKGIIHRDIKPSNVLVTLHDGVPVPKVIDFGIAKAVDRTLTEKTLFTQFQQMIGTPEYMSPEQAEMSGLDIDTRADVYSLGVLLYELLTGSKPFDMERLLKRGYEEILRTIREEDPPRPSTRVSTLGRREIGRLVRGQGASAKQLGILLRGDLDWIVMRALDKDRRRRYETAAAMADDVQRHLDDQPVTATPPTPWYRARKYVRRHRVGVIAASLVGVSLLSGLAAALWGWYEASDQRGVAEVALQSEKDARETEKAQRRRAEENEAAAKRERDEKEEARSALERALIRSEGTRLSALSQATLRRDPALALLLAIEGAERHTDAYANRALLDALEQSPRRELLLETDARVLDAVWLRNETVVVTGAASGALEAWDAATGKRMRFLETSYGNVVSLGVRGREVIAQFYSRGTDGPQSSAVLAWDPGTGETRTLVRPEKMLCASRAGIVGDILALIEPETESVILMSAGTGEILQRHERLGSMGLWSWPALSPDTTRYLTHSDGLCRLHDAQTGEILEQWKVNTNVLALPAFSADGRQLVTDEGPQGVRVRSAEDGSVLATLRDTEYCSRFRFTNGGRTIISTVSGTKTWDATTGELLRDFDFATSIRTGVVTPDGRIFAGANREGRVHWWNIAAGESLFDMPISGWIPAVASDGRIVVAETGRTRIVDPQPAGESLLMAGKANPCSFCMHPDGRHMVDVTGYSAEEGRVWDLRTRRPVRHIPAHYLYWGGNAMSQILDADYTNDGARLATGGPFGDVYVWNGKSGEVVHHFSVSDPGFNEAVTGVEFSPNGKLLALAGTMSQIRIHDVATGSEVCRLGDYPERANPSFMRIQIGGGRGVGFSPDGRRVLVAPPSKAPQVFDLASRRKLFELPLPSALRVQSATYSPCGRWICISYSPQSVLTEGKCVLFEAQSGARVREFEGINNRGPQFETGFGPKGNQLLTCANKRGVLLIDLVSGEERMTLRAPGEPPNRACFSPDGRWVLAVSHQEFHVYVWDARTGQLLHHLTDGVANSLFHNARFTNDSGAIVTAREHGVFDRRIRVLPIDLAAAAARLRPRDLKAEECADIGIGLPVARSPGLEWKKSNGLDAKLALEEQVDEAQARLHRILDDVYDESKLRFRKSVEWTGIEGCIAWAMVRVADFLVNKYGQFEEGAAVYAAALRETERAYGRHDIRAHPIRLRLTELLAQLGRGQEIGPHLDALVRKAPISPDWVALRRGDYLIAAGKPEEAIVELEKVSFRRRDFASQAMAEAYMDLGDYERAEPLLRGTFNSGDGKSPGRAYLHRRVGAQRGIRLYAKLQDEKKLAEWKKLAENNEAYRPVPIRRSTDEATVDAAK